MIRIIVMVIAFVVGGYTLKAEGFAVNVQGNKQTGMGHVGTALNWDASCLQFNPGALATLKDRFSLSAGGSMTLIKTEFVNEQTGLKEQSDNPVGTPFYLYGSYKVKNNLVVGLGVYTPFGNSMAWEKQWSGKYLVQDIVLRGIYIQPTVSYRFADWISVGAGLNVVYGSFDLNKAFPIVNPMDGSLLGEGEVNISGKSVKYGYNLGLFLQLSQKMDIGLSYRSKVDMEIDEKNGDGVFTVPPTLPESIASLFVDGGVSAFLPLPASLNVGVAYQINEKFLISADVSRVFWSEYESLDFTSSTSPLLNSQSLREWENTMIYRVGGQYSLNEKWDIRGGFYYDQTPTNDKYYSPETPGADKIGLSAGFSCKVGDNLSIDGSLLYINGEKQTAYETNESSLNIYGTNGFGGEYKNTGFIPGIGITYNF